MNTELIELKELREIIKIIKRNNPTIQSFAPILHRPEHASVEIKGENDIKVKLHWYFGEVMFSSKENDESLKFHKKIIKEIKNEYNIKC